MTGREIRLDSVDASGPEYVALDLREHVKGELIITLESDCAAVCAAMTAKKARELAFSLLDMADLADLRAGTFSLDRDPFEQQLIEEAATALANQL